MGEKVNYVETPRQIFDIACLHIASQLETYGYKYRKSTHTLYKNIPPFVAEIKLRSCSDNITGQYVEMNVDCRMKSKDSGMIYWDISIANLYEKPKGWGKNMRNLAPEKFRKARIEKITTMIVEGFVPLAEKYNGDIQQIVQQVIHCGITLDGRFLNQESRHISVIDVLNLVLENGSIEDVYYVLQQEVNGYKDLFIEEYRQYVSEGQRPAFIKRKSILDFMLKNGIPLEEII